MASNNCGEPVVPVPARVTVAWESYLSAFRVAPTRLPFGVIVDPAWPNDDVPTSYHVGHGAYAAATVGFGWNLTKQLIQDERQRYASHWRNLNELFIDAGSGNCPLHEGAVVNFDRYPMRLANELNGLLKLGT